MSKKAIAIFLLVSSISWFACKKVDIQFGDQFLDNGYTQIIKVDTFSAELSTIYVDSFVTSGKGVTMIGGYSDPVFGKITTQCYLDIAPPAYDLTFPDSLRYAIFDSLALVLKPDKSYTGDTSKPIQINVHQLAEPIVPYDNTVLSVYNTRSFSVLPTPLGTRTLLVRPGAGDSITIRLNDKLGKDLLTKLQDPNDADIKTTDAFLQYFYGLRLSGGNNDQLIFGNTDSVVMRMYYKKPGLYLENKTIDFTLAYKYHHFNNISVDRSGTILKDLAANKMINSTATGNTAFSLYTAGAMAKIRFTSARDILKLPSFTKLLKATLVIRPVRGSYGSSSFVLPSSVRLSTTTQLNQIGNDLTYITSNGAATSQTGNLVVDDLYGENTNYVYDVTPYLKGLLNDGTINQNGLLLLPPSPMMETQFGRLVIGNGNNTSGKIELLLVYAAVQ